MRVISSIFVFINLLVVGLSSAHSQKIYAAKGFARIRLEENLSREETRDMASQQAKRNAIEAVFGTYVSKDAYVDVADGAASVIIKGESELKGEWLKTTKEEFSEESRRIKDEYGARNEIWIICEVEGKVREITSPVIAYEFLTLNCPDVRCRTTDFNNGESLFLHFRTPVDGYLNIYLVDEQHAYRLLPYQEMPSAYLHNVPVEADREYLFFAAGIQYDYFDEFPYFLVDEIYLDTDKTQEFYKIYVMFSPEPFAKPILENEVDVEGDYTTPKTLRRRNFDVWVQDNRIFNTDFYYKTVNVRVRK